MFVDQFDNKISIAVEKCQKFDILTKLWPHTDSVWGCVWGYFGTFPWTKQSVLIQKSCRIVFDVCFDAHSGTSKTMVNFEKPTTFSYAQLTLVS